VTVPRGSMEVPTSKRYRLLATLLVKA
jgi:hypothetical protein